MSVHKLAFGLETGYMEPFRQIDMILDYAPNTSMPCFTSTICSKKLREPEIYGRTLSTSTDHVLSTFVGMICSIGICSFISSKAASVQNDTQRAGRELDHLLCTVFYDRSSCASTLQHLPLAFSSTYTTVPMHPYQAVEGPASARFSACI